MRPLRGGARIQKLHDPVQAQLLALAIVDTQPEPFVVLDDELRVVVASRSFYDIFKEDPESLHGQRFFDLGGGHWNDPTLRRLLGRVVPRDTPIQLFELEKDFRHLGRRTMVLSARRIHDEGGANRTILLGIRDITSRRLVEQEKQQLFDRTEQLLEHQQTLLREMRHRVANSLQIIASILLLKARSVVSVDTKHELQDAHQRVMAVAVVQSHLHASGDSEQAMGSYLTKLTDGLAASMIGPKQKVNIAVAADEGTLPTSNAVSIGLIVTELIINALKYAFPKPHASARVLVTFEKTGPDWKVTVADNGVGRPKNAGSASASEGLGTAIIAALAKQMDAKVSDIPTATGVAVEVVHATRLPSRRRAGASPRKQPKAKRSTASSATASAKR